MAEPMEIDVPRMQSKFYRNDAYFGAHNLLCSIHVSLRVPCGIPRSYEANTTIRLRCHGYIYHNLTYFICQGVGFAKPSENPLYFKLVFSLTQWAYMLIIMISDADIPHSLKYF